MIVAIVDNIEITKLPRGGIPLSAGQD